MVLEYHGTMVWHTVVVHVYVRTYVHTMVRTYGTRVRTYVHVYAIPACAPWYVCMYASVPLVPQVYVHSYHWLPTPMVRTRVQYVQWYRIRVKIHHYLKKVQWFHVVATN